jgi:hypothetical protein
MHDQGTRERRLFLSLLLIIAPFGAHAWTAATAATRSRGPLMFHRSTQRLSRAMSLTSLQEVAQRLVNNTTGSGVTSSSPLVCIVVAGGGGSSISTLASTEGASNVFLEGTVTYDQNAFHSYTNLPKSSSNDDDDEQEKFRYVSSEAAHLLSQAALKRALRYRPQLTDQVRCVGIGCTSSLISTASRPRPGRISRGHIVATRADGRQWECKLKLASTAKNKRRSRVDEDLIVSELILSGIEQIMMVSEQSTDHSSLGDDEDIVEQRLKEQHVPSTDIVQESAASIIEKGSVESVLLVPQKPDRDGRRFIAVQNPTIPQGCLIFPGSFNPPHVGHVTLANVAASRVDVPASTPVLLELSVTNPDKPSIDPKVVSERVHKFFDLDNMPQNWGVLLTSAPLFSQKVDIYSDQIVTGESDCCTYYHL